MRLRSEKIFLMLSCPVKCSIRKMAHILGISKSAMHRGKKAIEERNLFPESRFWETNELHIDKHVGSSPTTIKNNINKIQEMLEEYFKNQQSKQMPARSIKIVGGADETFFNEMILVFMDSAV